ncbi:hypothetical protein [Streptomyces capparidis]
MTPGAHGRRAAPAAGTARGIRAAAAGPETATAPGRPLHAADGPVDRG